MTPAEHYTKWHEAYLESYGDTIQACRSHDIEKMLEEIGEKARLSPGLKVLDCGGGYGFPAAFFSYAFGVDVLSINVTDCQLEYAQKNFGHLATFKKADFDEMDQIDGSFDRVLFLETLGHTKNIDSLMLRAFEKLSDGGLLFIKHPSCDRNQSHFKEVSDFYSYDFIPRTEVVLSALDAGFKIIEVKDTSYGSFDFKFVDKFKSHVDGAKCFVDFTDENYYDLRYVDFLFVKEI